MLHEFTANLLTFQQKHSLLLEIIIVYYHIADLGRHHGLIPPD